jgi:hypothetical protein
MIYGWATWLAGAIGAGATLLQEWTSRGGRFRMHCPEGDRFRFRIWAFPTGYVCTIHCPNCGLYEVTEGAEFIP